MNQEIFDKLKKVKEEIHVQNLIIWEQIRIKEEYYKQNMLPLILKSQELTRHCDHINPDGTSAGSYSFGGSFCTICGMEGHYMQEDITENPNHPEHQKN